MLVIFYFLFLIAKIINLVHADNIISWYDRKNWKICQKCRTEGRERFNSSKDQRFIPAIWYKKSKIKPLTERRLIRQINARSIYGLGNYRIKCFPRFSAKLDEIITYVKT